MIVLNSRDQYKIMVPHFPTPPQHTQARSQGGFGRCERTALSNKRSTILKKRSTILKKRSTILKERSTILNYYKTPLVSLVPFMLKIQSAQT